VNAPNPNKGKPATLAQLLMKLEYEKNPVTRAVYREIIANRLEKPQKPGD
jgi:hypothetical protein